MARKSKTHQDQGTSSDRVTEFYRRIGRMGVEALHEKLRRGETPLPSSEEPRPHRT
jgi:hypothetical protein